MMTGIGTPKSQSKIPRPILCLHEFLVPIVGEVNERRNASLGRLQQPFIVRRAQKNEREFGLVVVDSADFLQSQCVLVKFKRRIEIADAQHSVEITHVFCSLELKAVY